MITNDEDRVVNPTEQQDDLGNELSLRPQSFEQFVGQPKIIKNIKIMAESACLRGCAMDHCLFSGPPGLGKTSLSMLIAKAMGTKLHQISGPALDKKGDLAAILTNLEKGDVLFIDEIQRMHISLEELLYSALEDFRLDIIIGQGAGAKTVQIKLAPFTLIGATTRAGLLSGPLRDRFQAHLHFDFYNSRELAKILNLNSLKLGLELEPAAAAQISSRCRGTPRIAIRILRRVRDFSVVKGLDKITDAIVKESLQMMEIDQFGLDAMDRKILTVLRDYYGGGPTGIEALCATIREERSTLEDVFEPFLLQEGFILRTKRGRVISQKGLDHLGEIEST